MFNGVDWSSVLSFETPILEIVVRGTLTYLALLVLLRVVSKREVGAMGTADLLVIVLVADAAQNAMAGEYKTVADGVLLVAVILGCALLVDWLGYHVPAVERLLKPNRLPLVRNGRMLRKNMAHELVTEDDLWSQLRLHGVKKLSEVEAAYVEPDGRLSVLKAEPADEDEAAAGFRGGGKG
ncbi:MAG: DUF421 domain-containing protein [Actinomycetota bacterium]|nr:DUF421 domain-containing protein [Actinomycetota bacterium]